MNSLLTDQSETILAVFAHPDDETIGPGGALAEWSAHKTIVPVYATQGEQGEIHRDPEPHQASPADIRRYEAALAAKTLGLEAPIFFAYPDGGLGKRHVSDLGKRILRLARETGANTAVTFEPGGLTGHADHVIVTRAVRQALHLVASPLRRTAHFHWPDFIAEEVGRDYFVPVPPGLERGQAGLIVPVGDTAWQARLDALDAYQSQRTDVDRFKGLLHIMPREDLFTVDRV